MSDQNERKKTARPSSNIVFNLIALALLLTVIVFLHQILKKPKQAEETQVKSVATLPAAEKQPQAKAEVQLPAPPPVQIPLEPESKETKKAEAEPQAVVELPAKDTEIKPVEKKSVANAKPAKKNAYRADEEISPAEFDGESARQKYIDENKRLSSGKAKVEKSPTRAAKPAKAASELDREAAHRFEAPSKYDLDDEAARQKYQDENKRLSRAEATGEKRKPQPPAKQTSDEFIPFEDR